MADGVVDLSGQVALVTGGSAGLGRAIALALAGAGAAVCVCDVNPDRLEQVVDEIEAQGGRAIAFTGDVSKRFTVSTMIETIRDQLGGLQIVINAMAVNKRAAFLDLDEYDWRRVLDINLGGAFNCMQLAGRVMVAEGGGIIVNVLSGAAQGLAAESIAHAVSLAGLGGLTRSAAPVLIQQGVRVHAIMAEQGESETVRAAVAQQVLAFCSPVAQSEVGQVLRVGRDTD